MAPHRAGYAGLIGRPNVGKSTLLNNVLGTRVAATAPRPQTTRNRIAGILTRDDMQVVLVDTPGIHKARTPLNQIMVQTAMATMGEVDVVCWLVDAVEASDHARREQPPLGPGDLFIASRLEEAREEGSGCPLVVALNKVDKVERRWLLPVMASLQELAPAATLVPISALTGDGVDGLLGVIKGLLPEHPPLFPADQIMEQSERFVVEEIIREKLVRRTRDELPYATAVEVERFDESQREGERPLVKINARILVERKSQKGIVIGKGGSMLKRIGTEARQDLEPLLGARVYLELFVTVEEDWTRNPRLLRELGYK